MSRNLVTLNSVCKSFEQNHVLIDISFEIDKGSFVSIFGPNAAGKTTLLNLISGLLQPSSGTITWNEPYVQEKISYVFQNYRETLFPWKSAWENIALPLKLRGVSKEKRKEKVEALVNRFSITIDLKRYPYQLSGGQQQLVAILRALITEPELLLLDEPFSALDFQRRLFLQNKILEIWEQTKTTMIFISHDLEEAIYLADKVVLIGERPTTVLADVSVDINRPRNIEVLASVGFMDIKNRLLKRFMSFNTSAT